MRQSNLSRNIAAFWTQGVKLIDEVPAVPKWTVLSVDLFSMIACLLLFGWLSGVQVRAQNNPNQQSLAVQQAVTQQELISNSEKVAGLSKDVDYEREQIASMKDEIATMRGFGMGFASVLGVLQVAMIFIHLLSGKKTT